MRTGRCDGVIPASGRPIGWVPTREELDLLDIEDCEDIHELLSTPTSFWREEVEEMRTYFSTQVMMMMMMMMMMVMMYYLLLRWATASPTRCGASCVSLSGGSASLMMNEK